jgi:phospholipid/cholesterol/gamma-HCH transport system substrate-binding protein
MVLISSIILAVLILLMGGTGGWFTRKIELKAYFDDASGLRPGAPVRLSGVDIGNVTKITIVSDPSKKATPVLTTMKVSTQYDGALRKDSIATLSTAGVLGETYINIDSAQAKGATVHNGDVLPVQSQPDIQDVVRSSQSTLQNMDALLHRVDRIVAFVESGQGSIGKLIYDPSLYTQFAETVKEFKGLVDDVTAGNGTIGKLLVDETLYNKANTTVDKLNAIIDNLNAGQGTAGKLLKDPTLYNNANATIANVKQFTDDINAGKGAIGTLAKDEQFAAKLRNTMDKLSAISDRLEAGEGTAGLLLKDPALYNNANQMIVEGRGLVAAIRENPKKYLTIKLHVF